MVAAVDFHVLRMGHGQDEEQQEMFGLTEAQLQKLLPGWGIPSGYAAAYATTLGAAAVTLLSLALLDVAHVAALLAGHQTVEERHRTHAMLIKGGAAKATQAGAGDGLSGVSASSVATTTAILNM